MKNKILLIIGFAIRVALSIGLVSYFWFYIIFIGGWIIYYASIGQICVMFDDSEGFIGAAISFFTLFGITFFLSLFAKIDDLKFKKIDNGLELGLLNQKLYYKDILHIEIKRFVFYCFIRIYTKDRNTKKTSININFNTLKELNNFLISSNLYSFVVDHDKKKLKNKLLKK